MSDQTGRVPRSSPIGAAIDSASFALAFAGPNRSKEKIGVSWVDEDRCDDRVVSGTCQSEKLPVPASILGAEDVAVGCPEVDEVGP